MFHTLAETWENNGSEATVYETAGNQTALYVRALRRDQVDVPGRTHEPGANTLGIALFLP